MNQTKFKKLYQHYIRYFGAAEEPKIFHTLVDAPDTLHIDVVHLAPTPERPFQVLATIGASDYKMKNAPKSLSARNEYVTFVPAEWDLDKPEYRWIVGLLQFVANYPAASGEMISYAHTLDLTAVLDELQADDFNMQGAGLLFPEACDDAGVLRCKTGLLDTVTILHMMPLTRAEMDTIIARREQGEPDWADLFYPEEEDAMRFLCARKR